jgi:succinylglutamate desuccinylase
MKKILLLGSQHGNELLGEKLYQYMQTYRQELLPYVVFKIGNPEAHQKGVRYVESDMNRAYTPTPQTVEEYLARDLLGYIQSERFDLVLDLHTTQTQQPVSLMIGIESADVEQFIQASGTVHVVYMQHEIVKRSLIGSCARAVSIEVQNAQLDTALYDSLCDDIQRYIAGKKIRIGRKYFEISELLAKDELTHEQLGVLVNFEKSSFGFYPVLVGENSYKKQTNYLGFKAHLIASIRGK